VVTAATVLIVDDDPEYRSLLRWRTRVEPSLEIVGEAGDGESAVVEWRALRPDLVLMDVRMPRCSGIDAANAILDEDPGQAIVMFSADLAAAARSKAPRIVESWIDKADLRALLKAALDHAIPR
jgi:DNA-binding NarL/FixJ family response regulator